MEAFFLSLVKYIFGKEIFIFLQEIKASNYMRISRAPLILLLCFSSRLCRGHFSASWFGMVAPSL